MMILKALCKQLFGAKYERVVKSLAACLILFFAIRAAEIRMEIAPPILFLAAMAVSSGIMWQTLHSCGKEDGMDGMFMLPYPDREMTFSIVLAYTGYTLFTKTFPALALFFAVWEWSVFEVAAALLSACNGCFMAAAWYTMTREASYRREALLHKKGKQLYIVVLWCAAMLLAIFLVQEVVLFALIVLVSLFLSVLSLLMTDAYVFYRPASAILLIRRTGGKDSIFWYLLRYLMTNRNYLLNTVGLCMVGGALPMLLGQFEGLSMMPLGFAILCLNTPICILLSCDPDLEQAVRVLPGQAGRFCTRYTFFIFFINMAVNSVYLISWQMRHGGVGGREFLTAALIALQSAILSVCLEWICPIRGWKVENDLWHHPRKYIVPLSMLLLAGLIGAWPACVWVLLCVVIGEVFILLLFTRRI